MAPVAGALKMAATPAAAPATSRSRRSALGTDAGETSLQESAAGSAEIERGPFQTHRAAEAEGRDPRRACAPETRVSVLGDLHRGTREGRRRRLPDLRSAM